MDSHDWFDEVTAQLSEEEQAGLLEFRAPPRMRLLTAFNDGASPQDGAALVREELAKADG